MTTYASYTTKHHQWASVAWPVFKPPTLLTLIATPGRRGDDHSLVDPFIPLVSGLEEARQSHPISLISILLRSSLLLDLRVLVCCDTCVLAQIVQNLLATLSNTASLKVYDRSVVRLEVVPRVEEGRAVRLNNLPIPT